MILGEMLTTEICQTTTELSMNIPRSFRLSIFFRYIFSKKKKKKIMKTNIVAVRSESTLYSSPERQGTPCLKQAPSLKFKELQRDSNPQPLSS